jgi:hypothetical protein
MLKRVAMLSSLALAGLLAYASSTAPNADAPAYTVDGSLVAPAHYREWIFLSSGLDMSYTSTQETSSHLFSNTFVNPASYRAFLATGKWPDGTTIVLESRGAESPASINQRGHTQSAAIEALEFHVKDHGKWSFYQLPANAKAARLLPAAAGCQACHEAHAAVDTTFVQFYPTLLPVAQQKGTLSAAYLKEISAAPGR